MVLLPTDEAKFQTLGMSISECRFSILSQSEFAIRKSQMPFTVAWAVPEFHRTSFVSFAKRVQSASFSLYKDMSEARILN
jgi:hypothetical protein